MQRTLAAPASYKHTAKDGCEYEVFNALRNGQADWDEAVKSCIAKGGELAGYNKDPCKSCRGLLACAVAWLCCVRAAGNSFAGRARAMPPYLQIDMHSSSSASSLGARMCHR